MLVHSTLSEDSINYMQQYVTTNSSNREVQEVENSVIRVFNSLYNNALLNGPSIIKSQTFVANTDLTVTHKLGRNINGFIMINSNAPARIYQSSSPNISPTSFVILKSDANVVADFLFF